MDLDQSLNSFSLNKTIYVNLRWIGIIGQFLTINSVKFIFNFEFNYILANLIIFFGILSNIFLIWIFSSSKIICSLSSGRG